MRDLMMRGRWIVLALVALSASSAMAQPASERAQRLFDDGLKQLDGGHFAEACTAFEGSQKLDPRVTTLLRLADCREQNGQFATAWSLFNDARQMATTAGDAKLAGVATSHAHKLEPRLSRLTISVPPDRQVAGLTVSRGKDPVPPASWNRPVPVDGGSYTIAASAPGREPWSTTRAIKAEGDSQTIDVPKLAETSAPVAARAGSPAAPAVQPEPSNGPRDDAPVRTTQPDTVQAEPRPGPASGEDRPSIAGTTGDRSPYALPLALGGGAVLLGVVGLGLELSSERTYDRAKADNTAGNVSSANALRDSANTRRHLGQGFGVAAAACAGVAIYLYVRGRSESRSATAMTPVVSPELTGLAVAGRW
jgi:hypothetical protein